MVMINENTNIAFGYKAHFNSFAYKSFSNEMTNPLNTYSQKIMKNVDEGLDSFNSRLNERKGVPNLYKAEIEIDYFENQYSKAKTESQQTLIYGFVPKGLPDKIQKFIDDDAEFHSDKYVFKVKNGENNRDENPFEKGLNQAFSKVKSMIDRFNDIEIKLDEIEKKHVKGDGD